jgi:ribosomal protein S18 acetylase RimI-like enzyme
VFKPHEIEALGEVLDDYHAANRDYGHRAVTAEVDGVIVGFAYLAPAAMTDRTWELWWIAVDPARQGEGHGLRLLKHAEQLARESDARLLLIETSDTPLYEPTRGFYRKAGYTHAATVPDYYADGDGKVIYAKRFG